MRGRSCHDMRHLKKIGILLLLLILCVRSAEAKQKEKGYYKYISESYGAHAMGLEWVKSQLADKKGLRTVKVAVFDTSILKTHDVFRGRKVKNQLGLSRGSHFHGTAVAGVIADCTPGNVQIYGYRVNVKKPETFKNALKAAIRDNVDIINMCIGHKRVAADQEIEKLMKEAYKKNIILLAAAANNKENGKDIFPANSDYTFAVSALVSDSSRHDQISDMRFARTYSNYGKVISFSAPGSGVLIPREHSPHKFLESKGTSFATPHIAACFAYLKMFYPRKRNRELGNILKRYCVDKGRRGYDTYYGWGVPDMAEFYRKYSGKRTKNLAVIKKVKLQKKSGRSKKRDTCSREIVFKMIPKASYKLYRRSLNETKRGWEQIMTVSSRKLKKKKLYRFIDRTAKKNLKYEYLLYLRIKGNNFISRYALD